MARLFSDENKINIKEAEKKINKLIDSNKDMIDEKLLEKWNLLPVVFLEKDDIITKFVDIVKYIDKLDIEAERKVSLILTAIYLTEELKFDILNVEMISSYTLITYLDEVKIENMKEAYLRLNDLELIEEIRLKSLDLDVRKNILKYINEEHLEKEEAIKFLKETSYNGLIEKIR